ncbi:hypothetical protein [Brucella thiophenivorans]|uniref:Putative transposase n=1 Tax=Brucella thiophenivorans TaxID=571255 RepID=A0A256EXR9_9HYPH|nr:hypothetical protein [Brucella thiophenivorans]OYR07409.1 putative transposase [Brucella thiophenivorans]
MGLLKIIRRMLLRDMPSIREIGRRTGLSRNTVTKHVASGKIWPKFAPPDRPSKLHPYADKLSSRIKIEAAKSRKPRRNLKQLYADLVALGFDGSYGRVAAFSRCLIPGFDGALFSHAWRDALWDRFYTAAPPRLRQSVAVEQYKIVKRA